MKPLVPNDVYVTFQHTTLYSCYCWYLILVQLSCNNVFFLQQRVSFLQQSLYTYFATHFTLFKHSFLLEIIYSALHRFLDFSLLFSPDEPAVIFNFLIYSPKIMMYALFLLLDSVLNVCTPCHQNQHFNATLAFILINFSGLLYFISFCKICNVVTIFPVNVSLD